MLKTMTAALAVAVLFSSVVLLAADPSNERKLQQGIDLLENKHDLARAMPLFEQAAKSADRAVAVRALLYLGDAQSRQGKELARATYTRIMTEFVNQPDAVAEARRRRAALGDAPTLERPRYTQLLSGVDASGFLSGDGRFLSLIDWDSGDVAIQNIATGQIKRVFAKLGTSRDFAEYAAWAILSNDARYVAYLWINKTDYELRVIANSAGASPKTLVHLAPEYAWINPGAWSADGNSILVTLQKPDRTWAHAWVAAASGRVTLLQSLDGRLQGVRGSRPSISPDGQYVAFAALAANPAQAPQNQRAIPEAKDVSIYVLPSNGSGREVAVAKGAGMNVSPIWADDSHILFLSDRPVNNRAGSVGLWAVEIQNGKPVGFPEPTAFPDIGKIESKGVAEGSYYYVKQGGGGIDIFRAQMDASRTRVSGSPKRLIENFTDTNRAPASSPNGKLLAFKRRRPDTPSIWDLVVLDRATGAETAYPYTDSVDIDQPVWFHDNKRLLTGNGLVLDLSTWEFKNVRAALNYWLPASLFGAALSADDRTLYVAVTEQVEQPEQKSKVPRIAVMAFDLVQGERKTIWSGPIDAVVWNCLALSPDGNTLAMILSPEKSETFRLIRIGVDGKGYRDLAAAAAGGLAWTRDGAALFFMADIDGQKQLMRVLADGSKSEPTGLIVKDGGPIDLGADGASINFSEATSKDELWSVDSVFSLLKGR